MADYDNALYTEQTAATYQNPPTDFKNIVMEQVLITVPASIANAETIAVRELEVGTTIIPSLSSIVSDGAATGVSVILGDVTDPNRYVLTEDISAAGRTEFIHSAALPAGESTPYKVTETDKVLLLTTAGFTTWPAGSELTLNLAIRKG